VAHAKPEIMQLAESSRALASPIRILIVSYLRDHVSGTWSEVRSHVEESMGPLNPNTFHFHLKVLLSAAVIRRTGSDESPAYELHSITDPMEEALRRLPHDSTPVPGQG
jgi:DNA-binding transcriptional ArsR family regulator